MQAQSMHAFVSPMSLFVRLGLLLAILPTIVVAEDPAPGVQDLIAKVRPSVVTIRVIGRDGDPLGMGTGFVIDSDGLVATNFHVISEGRPFTVETRSGRKLPVVAIEASDRTSDLALIRVDVESQSPPALELAAIGSTEQGLRVLAFGNPLGLRGSVVEGIVSAVRQVEGREMIQLAMPIEPGNSGGPLVDLDGRVHGIVNMKSAIDQNLGFAIPIEQLVSLRSKPNPIAIDRWVRLGRLNEADWTTLFGAKWQQRGGMISARGMGDGFGGRSLCLSTQKAPEKPYEIAVMVRLDDESGAAGLAFCSDGDDQHYGFYPSNGRLRFTCFRGPTVFAWQVLEELDSAHYLPGQWNRLRVRVEEDRFKCYVNEHLVVESSDHQLSAGKIGLVKFRDTNPDFKSFQMGPELQSATLSELAEQRLAELDQNPDQIAAMSTGDIDELGKGGDAASRELIRRALRLEQQAEKMRQLAADVRLAPTLQKLRDLLVDAPGGEHDEAMESDRLLKGALLIASLDDADIDVQAYEAHVDEMATEIRDQLEQDADDSTRIAALDKYLFQENGFHGGRSEYYHPANSHLNRVMDDREGLPITMSILYMQLGRRIGLQIDGVGLPGHFVVKHVADDGTEQLIDVFDSGTVMTMSDAQSLVAANTGRPLQEEDLRAQTTREILSRVLRNLMGIASGNRDAESLRRYCEALVALNPDSAEFRMMRAQLRRLTNRTTAAMEDLDWLIENDPPGFDRAAAMQMRNALTNPD